MIKSIISFLLLCLSYSSYGSIDLSVLEWEKVVDVDGVVVHRSLKAHPRTGLHAFKVKTILSFPMSRIISVLVDTPRKKEWVPRHIDTKYIQIMGPYERIEYTRYQAPWPFADRDFVLHIKAIYDQDQKHFFVSMDSVEDKRKPPVKKVVRASSYISHIHLRGIDENTKTDTEMIFMADLKGVIPSWAMDIIQKVWPRMILQNLTKQLKKDNIKLAEEFLSGLGIPL